MNNHGRREQLIRQLSEAVQRQGNLTVLMTHAIAECVDLSATEFETLDVLGNSGPMTAGQLAKLVGLSTGGVTGMIDRLEKAGFVRRTADPLDRRKVIVEVVHNEATLNKIRRLYQPLATGFSELVDRYTDAELATVLDFCNRSCELAETFRAQLKSDHPS